MGKRAEKDFTATTVANAKPREKPYEIADAKIRGLRLRVQKSGVKSWVVVYHKPNGSKTRKTLGDAVIKTLAQARTEAKDVLRDADKGIDPNQVDKQAKASTLGAYLSDHYAEHARAHMKGHKNALNAIYRNFGGDPNTDLKKRIKPIVDLSKKPIRDVSEMDITRWRKSRHKNGVTFETLKRDFTSLKACLNTAVRVHKIAASHQLERFTLKRRTDNAEPSNAKGIRYLLPDEEKRLRAALDAREARMRQERESANAHRTARGRDPLPPLCTPYVDYLKPLVLLALNTGLRRGDLFDLQWEHVDLAHRQIRKVINKTARSNATTPAVLPLSNEALETLRGWKGQGTGTGLVFPSTKTDGRRDNPNTAWRNLLSAAKIDNFRFHDLRHTFASRLVMAGVDINTVRELMTHADIKMTLVYAHLSPDHKAAAVDKAFGRAR